MQVPEAMHRKKKRVEKRVERDLVEFITRYRDARGGIWIEVTGGSVEAK
jgi:hypothetical protein